MGHGDLLEALRRGPCFGPFLKLPRPEVVDLLKQAGFDFVIVDMEHGQISEIEARTVIQACAAAGLPAVVRLPDASSGVVNRLLEVGAVGIQMPKVRARTDAERLRAMMHFPPEGVRSIGIANQWAQYGAVPTPTVVEEANARSVAIGMFETKEFADPMEEILKPLDAVFIGPGDLSIEFGLPGDHPDVQAYIRKIEEAARNTNTILGFAASTPQQAAGLAARGYRYIALSNDISMLSGAANGLISGLKQAREAPPARPPRRDDGSTLGGSSMTMLDSSDPRSQMASYGTGTARPPATEYHQAEYIEFHQLPPAEESATARTWYGRGTNFIVSYSDVTGDASFERRGQVDEYVLMLPDRSVTAEVTATDGTKQVDGYSLTFVPPGDSSIRTRGQGRVVRIFSTRSEDLAALCSNADAYAKPHPNTAPLEPWPVPPDGYKTRTYSLDVPAEPSRFGKIFRCTTIMVNYMDPSNGPRDVTKLSPHSHDDFEQCSLVLEGEYIHHIRFPWTSNLNAWIEDEHRHVGSPSMAVIPPPSVHTSQAVGSGLNHLIDIFSPPRFDFSEKEGWVLNAADYPMPAH